LPRRIEPLGGQNTSYVQLDNVLALLDATETTPQDRVERIKRQTGEAAERLQAAEDGQRGLKP
jgi:hypothetical protein